MAHESRIAVGDNQMALPGLEIKKRKGHLMAHESRIAVGDNQMALPFLDLKSGRKIGGGSSGRIDDDFSGDLGTVRQTKPAVASLRNPNPEDQLCSACLRPLHQEKRCAGWIHHTVLRDEKTSSHPWAKVGLKALQCFSIEHFRWNSTLAEVGSLAVDLDHRLSFRSDEKPSSHPWAKVGLKALQCFSIEHFRWNSTLAEVGSLAVDLDHFLFVSRDPDRATLFVLDIIGQFGPQSLPQLLRVASQRKLRVAVIHDNDVAHS